MQELRQNGSEATLKEDVRLKRSAQDALTQSDRLNELAMELEREIAPN